MASPSGPRKRSGAVSLSKCDSGEPGTSDQQHGKQGKTVDIDWEADCVIIERADSASALSSVGEQGGRRATTVSNTSSDTATSVDVGGYDHCFVGEIPDEYVCGICSKVGMHGH